MTIVRRGDRIYVEAGDSTASDGEVGTTRPAFEIVPRQPWICNPEGKRWGWVLRASNNRVVAMSDRDYSSEHHARRAVHEITRELFGFGFVFRKSGEK